MANFRNLEDLFEYQLNEIYDAETQLLNALPDMEGFASERELKDTFSEHLKDTQNQKERLEEIADTLDIDLSGERCEAIYSLIDEIRTLYSDYADSDVNDAGLISYAQRIEHYEIAGYGTLINFAKTLDHGELSNTLRNSRDEESKTDKRLNELAVNDINGRARG